MDFPTPLVSPSWLGAHLSDVTLVDCRFDLTDPAQARAGYEQGHIPGAAYLSLEDDLSDMSRAPAAGRHPLPTAAAFERSARRAGISADRPVVAYDQGMTGGAARLWWLLTHFGHPRVAVLDGGLAGWPGPLDAGAMSSAPGDFSAGDGRRPTITAEEIGTRVGDPGFVLLDARDADRFRGTATGGANALDPASGHIPGAQSLPFPDAIANGTADAIREHETVAVYCGSGVTACVLLLALERDGRSDVVLYPGSWSEWSRRELPVATGDASAQ
jgi:thiosulfate/3-mercaptopyruvate sulfurtransferase